MPEPKSAHVDTRYYEVAAPGSVAERILVAARDRIYRDFIACCRPAQTDTLLDTSEVSFNTFETFRGTDAAHVFARVLAVTRHVLGARSFTIEPYQLGHGNDEGLQSGAWWFYAHLGFRPKDPKVRRLHRSELMKMERSPEHRSSLATLGRLAAQHLYWNESAKVPAILPGVPQLGLGNSERLEPFLRAVARAKAHPDEDKSLEAFRKLRGLARVLTS